jgi:protein phosphatase 1 regulatory subunit 7
MQNLRILALQNNSIEEISGLDGLVNLEELYLSNNRITTIGGLEQNVGDFDPV